MLSKQRTNKIINSAQFQLPSSEFSEPKIVLRRIRNFLAGQVVGATRDEAFLEEILKCAYSRIHLEKMGKASSPGENILPAEISEQYNSAFQAIQSKYPTLFTNSDRIIFTDAIIQYIDKEFALINLAKAHDIVGDIYEAFIGNGFQPNSQVWLGNSLLEATYVNANTLLATVPAYFPTGTYSVKVVNLDYQVGELPSAFEVILPSYIYLPTILMLQANNR